MTTSTEIGYRGPAACERAGITYRQLDHWARIGLVVPSITEAHGSGTQRRYSALDVLALCVVGALSRRGVHTSSVWARDAVDVLRVVDRDLLRAGTLVLGDAVPVVLDPYEVRDYVADRLGDVTLLLPLGPLADGLF